MNFLLDPQFLAAARNILAALAGVMATLGLITIVQSQELMQAVMDIADGFGKAAVGIGTVISIVTPGITAWYASRKSSPAQQRITIMETRPDLRLEAVAAAKPADLLKAVSEMPAVTSVKVTTRALADSIPSEKVVSK